MATCGLMSSRARTEEDKSVSGFTYKSTNLISPKSSLSFNLDNFSEFKFTSGAETVVLSPAEIMAALKS